MSFSFNLLLNTMINICYEMTAINNRTQVISKLKI